MENYSKDEIKDIQDREKKALKMLAELELTPAATIQKVNIGNDTFADKVTPYLQDIRYVKKNNTKNEESLAS